MVTISAPRLRHVPWTTYGAVGTTLGLGVWYALWCAAAFLCGAYQELVENTLAPPAFWPYTVFLHGDITGPETNTWQDLVPFAVSIVTWMAIGALVALALCFRRSRMDDVHSMRAGSPRSK